MHEFLKKEQIRIKSGRFDNIYGLNMHIFPNVISIQ